MKKITLVGLGGIGSNLVVPLARFLNSKEGRWKMTLVDGDIYEERNADRQNIPGDGNKAVVTAEALSKQFPQLVVDAKPWYINQENALLVIEEGTIVILCVDNHPTRKLVSEFCEGLSNVTLISGGNDLLDGNVQVYIRQQGKDVTASLTQYHPEIKNPKGRHPSEVGCEDRSRAEPQLLVTNFVAAAHIFAALYRCITLTDKKPGETPGEIYFSIQDGSAVPVLRSPTET